MKILHTSDWHLGISLYNYSLIEEQTHFCEEFFDIAVGNKADVIIIAGDIFDTSVSNLEAIKLYNNIITRLIRQGIKVIITAGNHDGATRLSVLSDLLVLNGLYIAGSILKGIKQVEIEDCVFYLIPYFNIEEVRLLYPNTQIQSYEDAMATLINNIDDDKSKINIAVSHSYVSGGEVTDSDKTILIGGVNKVSDSIFEKFNYTALGHLHKSQTLKGKIRYSGSPVKFSFSEANTQKSVTLIDTATMEIKEIALTPKTDMRVLKGTLKELRELSSADVNTSDLIKIEIKDEYAHMEIYNGFKNIYPNLLLFEGKSYSGNVGNSSISMEKMADFSITDIMCRFYEESTGESIDTTKLNWFKEAISQTDGEVE